MRIASAHQRTAEVRAKNTKKWIEKEDIEGLNLNKRISESNICCYNGEEQVNLAVASLVEAWIEIFMTRQGQRRDCSPLL